MFGCVVAGRLLQTGLTQVDETHAYFELANADAINHVCVFLLGTGKRRNLSLTRERSRSYQYLSLMDSARPFTCSGRERASSCSACEGPPFASLNPSLKHHRI
jgi:hypothetical protein